MTYPIANPVTNGLMGARHAQLVQSTMIWSGTSTGSANAQVIAPEFTGTLKGHPTYVFIAGYSNTGATTLSLDGGATNTSLRNTDGTAMVGGEVLSGSVYTVAFDGTYWRLSGGALSAAALASVVNGLSDGSSVIDNNADWIPFYDTSAGVMKKVNPAYLRGLFAAWLWSSSNIGTGITLSGGSLIATSPNGSTYGSVLGTVALSGKRYFEVKYTARDIGVGSIGISVAGITFTNNSFSATTNGYGYGTNGNKYNNGTNSAFGSSYTTGDIIGVYVDMTAGKVWFSKNGVLQASGDPVAGTNAAFTFSTSLTLYPAVYLNSGTNPEAAAINSPLSYSPATGYAPL